VARVTVKIKPGDALDKVRALARQRVHVGVLGESAGKPHKGTTLTNVDVATIHEFGAPEASIPARSFLRSTVKLDKDTIAKFVASRLRQVVAGKLDPRAAYEQVGLKVVALVRARIRAGIAPPLKRREGVPLIDTGQLISSISHEVRQ
jgi:hypothetical protein